MPVYLPFYKPLSENIEGYLERSLKKFQIQLQFRTVLNYSLNVIKQIR